ncbi:MAG: tyrosine-type recombinase/integrase, partial [Pseudolabrys sp.]
MARKVKSKELDSREARLKLKPQGKPYWRAINRGLHLGYRRLKGKAGTWWARHYIGKQQYETEALGIADDLSDADGLAVLDFWEAQAKSRDRMTARAHAAAGKTGPITVADAMAAYLEFLENNRRSARDARSRIAVHILPTLGEVEVDALTADQLRKWHAGLAKAPRAVRAKAGKARRLAIRPGEDGARARRASANRTLTTLKAALNRVWRDGKAQSDQAWRSVEPFEAVDAARVRYLTIKEAQRLINACGFEFRPLVQAALQTGARYGELIRLQVHDFNPDAGTLAIRQSKSGKPRHVVLSDEGAALFRQLTAG